ncbi:MAG: serine protease [Bacilli bacterium]|uniref:S1C family serine protease n=1 Tax=Ureibacillus sp. FSL W7-1570 TaxID=2954593 RepID=UPI001ECE5858|nr:serine protease [Bacilli bacterium]
MANEEKHEQEPMNEEEFLEIVLEAQKEALEKEREDRLKEEEIAKKPRRFRKMMALLMAIILAFSTFAVIFEIYSIPAIEFLKTSARLSSQKEIQSYKKAVVQITTEDGKGTGFSISENGLIVTNEHVIDDALTIKVSFPDNGLYKGEVVATYPEVDLALLQVDGKDLPYLTLSEKYQYLQQESIYIIGNPLYFTGIANEGHVLEPVLLADWEEEVYMIDAPVYRGNSGSPVINDDGKVIGIIFATLDHEKFGQVGLFIPVAYLQERMSNSSSPHSTTGS